MYEGDVVGPGERLLRRYLELWETPGTGARLLAAVRGSPPRFAAAGIACWDLTAVDRAGRRNRSDD
ncbi:hypothetical protein [Nonomuraea sp. NPDC050783]|uniref:hypothetical protein n=1 Tax=Nonomuraea sp. NPDC050783 TaxID=3154634 RepID=UPI003465BDBA